jgi:pimeloyl-ACP methyl ester carboxylesterase
VSSKGESAVLQRSLAALLFCLCAGAFAPMAHAQTKSATVSAPTQRIEIDGAQIAFRAIGPNRGVPLLLLNRFRGTMDDWDPALIDRIAAERRVLMFDQPGFSRSSGTPPDALGAFADNAARLVHALGYPQVDVLGFSMGGTVALQFALDHPALLRRLIVAGSGPGHVPNVPPTLPVTEQVWPVATKPVNDDADFLFLFFENSPASQTAGRAYRERLRQRDDAHTRPVGAVAWQAQLRSAMAVGTEATSLLPRLGAITQPVLVANGRRDIMVPTYASFGMAQALPNARLLIYPDSGHGFLFQFAEDFADEVLRFLR